RCITDWNGMIQQNGSRVPLHPEGEDYGEKETDNDQKHYNVKQYTLVAPLHAFVHKSHLSTSQTKSTR
ncbi:MAG: hypothetical protein ACM3UW_01895, partial [Bacillota bacterium]